MGLGMSRVEWCSLEGYGRSEGAILGIGLMASGCGGMSREEYVGMVDVSAVGAGVATGQVGFVVTLVK